VSGPLEIKENSERLKNAQVEKSYGKPKSWRNSTRNSLLGYFLIMPVVLLTVSLLGLPLMKAFKQSFYDIRPAAGKNIFIGLRGYKDLLADPLFWTVFSNSIVWTVFVVVFQFLLGLTAALVLNYNFRFRWLIRILMIIPWALPGIVVAMMWRLILNPDIGTLQIVTSFFKIPITDYLGQSSTALISVAVTAVWKGFAFWMLIILAALQGVPKDQIEAASVDGAGLIRAFFSVYIPNMMSVLRIGFILTSIWTFNYFELVFVMTAGGPAGASHTFPTIIYEQALRRLDFGLASRFGIVSCLILLIPLFFLIKEVRRNEKI
jgi:multiple sugar transport system permease protein